MTFKIKLKNFFGLERNIVILIVANLFWSTMILYRQFLPKFYESLGASVYFIGLLYSLSDLFYALSSFIGGHITDIYGRKHVFVRAAFAGNFLLLGYFFAPNWIFLMPFLMFRNFTAGLEDASAQTLISESLPKKRRATGLASVYLTATIVSALLIPIGASLVQKYGVLKGVKIAILASFVSSLVGTVIFLFHGKETLNRKVKKMIKFDFKFSKLKKFFKTLPLSIKGIFLFISLSYFSSMLLSPFWILYVLDVIKINPFEFGILASIQFITVAVFSFAGAKVSDKYGRKKILLASIMLSLIAQILFIFSRNFIQLVFVNIVGGISTLGYSTVFAYITDNIDKKRRSKSMGIANGLMAIAGIPAPMIGSLFYSIMPQYPFVFSSLLLAISLIVGIKLLR